MTRALLVALAIAALPSPAAAGGWVQKEGGFYGKLTSRLLLGDGAYALVSNRSAVQRPVTA